MNSYSNETGTRSHRLVIELGNLKFCLRDSQNLIAIKLKDQKEKDEQQEAKEKEAFSDVFEDSKMEKSKNSKLESKVIPKKREHSE